MDADSSPAGCDRNPSLPVSRWRTHLARRVPWIIFVLVLIVYQANGDLDLTPDATPNVCGAISLLKEGNLSFTAVEAPFMFGWELETATGVRPLNVVRWDQAIDGVPARDLLEKGLLRVQAQHFYLVPASQKELFVGSYGPGGATVAAPLFALATLVHADLSIDLPRAWWLGKIAASMLAAGSVAFIYLAGLTRLQPSRSLLIAAAYGCGTCVWSVSSQNLWQQTPMLFFLTLGTWQLLKLPAGTRWTAFLCGLSLGFATLCRPTAAVVAVCAGVGLAAGQRKSLAAFVLGGTAPALLLALYNLWYFGSPLTLGISQQAGTGAFLKTGSREVWGTPLWTGLAGVLVSPSRGLLIFSPFLAFSFWGLWRCSRDPEARAFRPLAFAATILILVYSKYSDWWGGWSFGNRLLLDVVPLLTLLLIPVCREWLDRPAARTGFILLLGWSVAVQVLGAFAYTPGGWNARVSAGSAAATFQKRLNIDRPEHRGRLWSIADSQILYSLTHFAGEREEKRNLDLRFRAQWK